MKMTDVLQFSVPQGDYHVHTYYSDDSETPMEKQVESCRIRIAGKLTSKFACNFYSGRINYEAVNVFHAFACALTIN